MLYAEETQLDYGIVRSDSGELVGSCDLYYRPEREEWEVGYNLRSDSWGKGFAFEAMNALIDFARQHFSVRKISGSFAVDNLRSRRVMEKLGMTFERTEESVKFDGSETFKTNIFSKILNDDKI